MVDASKLKKFADDNFKFDENCRKFSKRLENTVGTGKKNDRHEQFLLFPQCFKRLVLQTHKYQGPFGNGLTPFQTTNFRLFQTERVCRRQFQI